MTRCIYLHGFASGPGSAKAQAMRDRLAAINYDLAIPDLNQDDFAHLTLSRQIQQGVALVAAEAEDVVLFGSSFGGLTAAWLAEQTAIQPRIRGLVLLAPAFDFLGQWLPRLRPAQLATWQRTGTMPIFHYGYSQLRFLHYNFVADAQRYDDAQLRHPVPTLVLHGRQDEVISVEASRAYCAPRPWTELVELESDHGLIDQGDTIWQQVKPFLGQLGFSLPHAP